jgi:hypothetical protein
VAMIEITKEILDRIHTDSDIYELAKELGVSFRELDYAINNKYAEGTACYNCKYVSLSNCGIYPCNDCSRRHRTDYYEHIDIESEEK